MTSATRELLLEAGQLHRQGDLGAAGSRYRAVLAAAPDNPDALYGLAVIACQQGRFGDGAELAGRTVAVDPRRPRAHNLLGIALSRIGRASEAAAAVRQAIALQPDFAEAHGNLANALVDLGRHAEAIASYDRAVAFAPDSVTDWCNRGAALADLDRHGEALASYTKARELSPDSIDIHRAIARLLVRLERREEALAAFQAVLAHAPADIDALVGRADALLALGRPEEALRCLDQALAIAPDHIAALNNRGVALGALSRHPEALAAYDTALRLDPTRREVLFNRSATLEALDRPGEAAQGYDRVLALDPGHVEALCNRGRAFSALNRFEQALASYQAALAIAPEYTEALFGCGQAMLMLDRPAAARALFERVLALDPDHAAALDAASGALLELGQVAEAIVKLRRAVELVPDPVSHTGLIFTLNFDPQASTADLQAERARWYACHGRPLAAQIKPHGNDRDPDRRLRIGYVGGHFRRQAGTFAFGGVILHHDPQQFEVVCYSDTAIEDDVTERLRTHVDLWCDCAGLSDDMLAERIRAQGIDILVDTTGHMAANRLLVFARKPAPVQVTGWGEPTGTGVPTIDYLMADPVLVPAGERALLAERVADLPNFLGYWTPEPLPEPSPPPFPARGYVTFGSFNRLIKVQEPVLRVWAAILRALPTARLVIKTDQLLGDTSRRERIDAVLAGEGIAAGRVDLIGRSERADHFAAYHGIDMALDPFPHGGGMTTLDSLWMGVPVVTFAGRSISSRLAAASLSALGLGDFVAGDPQGYVDIAVAKATDRDGLIRLRASLRGRMAASDIGDPRRYARAVEAAYRGMWRRWCESAS